MSDRKYRHRGYQDDDRDREQHKKRERPKTDGVRRFDSAPRGRGLGAPTKVSFKCARCGHELALPKIATDTSCTSCGDALHSCANCTFFNTGSRFECQKPIAKRVESKVKGNECKFFKPKAVRDLKVETPGESSNDPRAAFDALFKKLNSEALLASVCQVPLVALSFPTCCPERTDDNATGGTGVVDAPARVSL